MEQSATIKLIMETTQTPQASDRLGRLGSANAQAVYNIGLRGSISDSDNELLALLKGQKENKDISSEAMQLGCELEDTIFELLKQTYPNAISNPYYESEKLSKQYGFKVSNHIDYEIETETELIHIENKAFRNMDGIDEVEKRVELQLVWHYMLLKEKATKLGKECKLMISYYDTTDYDGDFKANKLQLKQVDTNTYHNLLSIIKRGLKLICEVLPTFEYKPKEELALESTSLPLMMQSYFTKLRNINNLLKEAEKEEKVFKEKMYALMDEKNIKKIDLLDLDLSITRVLPTTSLGFDKKALQKDHPKIYKKYITQSEKKGFVKLNFKEKKGE